MKNSLRSSSKGSAETEISANQRLQIALESARQGVWEIDLQNNKKYHSPMWFEMRGLSEHQHEATEYHEWFSRVHLEDRQHVLDAIALNDKGRVDVVRYDYRERTADGSWISILSQGRIISRDNNGSPLFIIGTDTDITLIKQAEDDLKRLSHRYELAVSTAKVGVWEFDLTNCRPIWDDNTREIFGVNIPNEDMPNDIWDQRIHPDDRVRALATSGAAVQNRTNYAMDYRIVLPCGEVRNIRCRAVYYEDKTNGPRLIGVNWDVTQDFKHAQELENARELAEKRSLEIENARIALEYNALHDALTQLPNRRHLDDVLSKIDQHENSEISSKVALMHVDLDRFKQINDTLGHIAGDAILRRVATVLKTAVGNLGIVCRSGGDEFVIVLCGAFDDVQLSELATNILKLLSEPVIYDGHECLFGASIGIAVQDQNTASGRGLLINADLALYQAKSDGRNRFCFFTVDMHQQAVETKKCADDIKRGLERKEFFAVYQLQFDARSLEVIGVEALARWNHPERGELRPDAFLQVAEEINAVARIDEIILEQALKDLTIWRNAGLNIPNVSVNISAKRLSDAKLIEGLRKLDIPKDSLSFELLESIYLDNHDDTIAENLHKIRQLGIGIEIDDFGTGHASIACLLKLRPKRLKIDRVLISPIVVSVETRRLLASIVDIGQALGIEVLAEGVETMEHARILANVDCASLQGFALAKPMKAADLVAYVSEEKWRQAA